MKMFLREFLRYRKKLLTYYWSKKIAIQAFKIGKNIKVNGPSRVNKYTTLGDNVHFNGLRVLGEGELVIGNNFHSGIECLIITDSHNYTGNRLPYDDRMIEKPVVIGDNVWLGARVTIIGKVNVGEGAIVQAGSVIFKDVPPLAIVGVAPTKIISSRDSGHYYSLR